MDIIILGTSLGINLGLVYIISRCKFFQKYDSDYNNVWILLDKDLNYKEKIM